MQVISTVTQKGQVTIPKKLREKLGIDLFDKVYLKAERDHIKIKPTYDILDMAGKFKPGKKPLLAAREKLEKKYKRF